MASLTHEFERTPGYGEGQGSLVGCRLWGRTESDTAEASWQQQQQNSFEPKLLKAGLQAEESSAALGWDWPEELPWSSPPA